MEQKRIADKWDAQNEELLNKAERDHLEGRGDPVDLETALQLGFVPVISGSDGAQEEQRYQAWGHANIALLDFRNPPQGMGKQDSITSAQVSHVFRYSRPTSLSAGLPIFEPRRFSTNARRRAF